jgi:hypothetical protein
LVAGKREYVDHLSEFPELGAAAFASAEVRLEGFALLRVQRIQKVRADHLALVVLIAQSTANPLWLFSSRDFSLCRPMRILPLTVPRGTSMSWAI